MAIVMLIGERVGTTGGSNSGGRKRTLLYHLVLVLNY